MPRPLADTVRPQNFDEVVGQRILSARTARAPAHGARENIYKLIFFARPPGKTLRRRDIAARRE